jgi:hypothetical protein
MLPVAQVTLEAQALPDLVARNDFALHGLVALVRALAD